MSYNRNPRVVKQRQQKHQQPHAQISQSFQTIRDRFHDTISPFLLPIFVIDNNIHADNQYVSDPVNPFTLSHPSVAPCHIRTWLDTPLHELTDGILFKQRILYNDRVITQNPDEWTELIISSIYIGGHDQCDLHYLTTLQNGVHSSISSMTLFQLGLEIGDCLEIKFIFGNSPHNNDHVNQINYDNSTYNEADGQIAYTQQQQQQQYSGEYHYDSMQ